MSYLACATGGVSGVSSHPSGRAVIGCRERGALYLVADAPPVESGPLPFVLAADDEPGGLGTMVYNSGTSGDPKRAMVTQHTVDQRSRLFTAL